jgi:hypothetical protein
MVKYLLLLRPAYWLRSAGLGLALLGLLGGCRPAAGRTEVRERVVMQASFESLPCLLPDSLLPSLSAKRAHSGRFALRVDSAQEYSSSYRMRLGQLFAVRPRKLRIRAWAWVPRYEDVATLVVAISAPDDPNRLVYYQAVPLADGGPFQQWKPIVHDVNVPGEVGFNSQINLYLWRVGATQPVYLDDLSLAEIR